MSSYLNAEDQELDDLNDRMVAFCESWQGPGLGPYYQKKMQSGAILGPIERAVLDFVCEFYPLKIRILEVGCGIGQLCHALDQRGFDHIVGCDVDGRRRGLALELGQHLDSQCLIVDMDWLAHCSSGCLDLVVGLNLVSSHFSWPEDVKQLAFCKYPPNLILCPSLFGTVKPDRDPSIPGYLHEQISDELFHYRPKGQTWPNKT